MSASTSALTAVVALLFAFFLDHAFGEPPARWHPVVWMGCYLSWTGNGIAPRRPLPGRDGSTFLAGVLAWSAGAAVVALTAWVLQQGLDGLGGLAAGLLLGALLKPLLAWRMLRDEVLAVEAALDLSLAAGRLRLARLVSRDVSQLSEAGVREAAIESLAENLCDSVVAPVFWFIIAGLPGAALYRFANTADAMWGYRGFREGADWTWAGKWAARADDLLSWIPARITALLIAMAAWGLPLARLHREARRTASPNSGWPMAAMALALDVRLSKPDSYALNGEAASPLPADTARAVDINARAIAVLLAGASLALWTLQLEWPW